MCALRIAPDGKAADGDCTDDADEIIYNDGTYVAKKAGGEDYIGAAET